MRAMVLALLFALLPVVALAAPLKLKSGTTVEVLAVGPMHFAKGPPALTLKYRTGVSLEDLTKLRMEVDEIWQRLAVDADAGKFENALIMAAGPETGLLIKTGKSYNFVFEKVDGVWRAIESGVNADTKLDDRLVRSLLARWDWHLDHHSDRALALYLDKTWRLSVTGDADGPIEYTPTTFIEEVRKGDGQTILLEHRRDVQKITINAKTNTAVVESRETTRRRFKDRLITLKEDTKEDVSLRDQMLLITKSASTIETFDNVLAPKP